MNESGQAERTKHYNGFAGWISATVPLPKPGTFGWKVNGVVTRLHARLLRRTRGRLGGSFDGAPLLVLHSTGAKSGQRRQNPTIYMPDGDNLVIVASIGGNPKNPAWYHNLKAHPDDVEVDVRGKRRRVRAREASADEAAALWPRLFETYPGFKTYMTRTDRQFPVMILEPR
jgi:deazaflavin-dependent oxidoreductase (nitroreductase family)